METATLDEVRSSEVRMYRRMVDGRLELFFYEDGHPYVVGRYEDGPLAEAIDHDEVVHNAEQLSMPRAILPRPVEKRTRRMWSFEHLLGRGTPEPKVELPEDEIDAPELGDDLRRRAARERVQRAAQEASRLIAEGQMRYELALQAHNGNTNAMAILEGEAKAEGITVAALAERIIAERRRNERRLGQVYEVLARALKDIEAATGERIATVEIAAAREITGAAHA